MGICNEYFFMKMMILTIIFILYNTNEWNPSINSQNVIMKSIECTSCVLSFDTFI
jgi:hypothetical protein